MGLYAYQRSLTNDNDVDLNYRMDIPDHEMRKTLGDNDWENGHKFETLLRFDQVCSSHSPEPYQNNSHPLLT